MKSILIVDDEEESFLLINRALSRLDVTEKTEWLKGGEYLIDRLQELVTETKPLPTLIVLDLKMPRTTGYDVLAWMRKTPGLDKIFTVVMSSSTRQEDVVRATELDAKQYLEKFPSSEDLKPLYEEAKRRAVDS